MRTPTTTSRLILTSVLLWLLVAVPQARSGNFVTFESGQVRPLALSPDGNTIASTTGSADVFLWNLARGEVVASLSGQGDARRRARDRMGADAARRDALRDGHNDAVTCVAWSTDGQTLATGSRDRTVRLWDGRSGTWKKTLAAASFADEMASSPIASLAWSRDGSSLAAGTEGGTVDLWNVQTSRVSSWPVARAAVQAVAFDPTGRVLASLSSGAVRFWDARPASGLAELSPRHARHGVAHAAMSSRPVGLAWSPNGRLLAVGGDHLTLVRAQDLESLSLRAVADGERVFWFAHTESGAFDGDDAAFDRVVLELERTEGRTERARAADLTGRLLHPQLLEDFIAGREL